MPSRHDVQRAAIRAAGASSARSIYLDHNATTPVDSDVFAVMEPFFTKDFGNAASRTHQEGQTAFAAVEHARESVARLVGADSRNIVWTSGGTEANNLAVKGAAQSLRDRGRHIVTQATEHPSVLDTCEYLRDEGFEVQVLPVTSDGVVPMNELLRSLRKDTVLVSIMHANNETGVIQPVEEISKACREHGILFHCDATQAVGKLDVDTTQLGVDLLSLSAHKLYGPKGVGALFVRGGAPKVRLSPLLHGGGHERGMRSGTLNVPGIAGFGRACELARTRFERDGRRLEELRRRFEAGLLAIGGAVINGARAHRLPNTTSVSFEDVDAEAALVAMPELALSTGSACTSMSVEPSHVLRAMGVPERAIRGTLRASFGRNTKASDIEIAVVAIHSTVSRLRALRHVS